MHGLPRADPKCIERFSLWQLTLLQHKKVILIVFLLFVPLRVIVFAIRLSTLFVISLSLYTLTIDEPPCGLYFESSPAIL